MATTRIPKTIERAREQAHAFNERHPVGTPVTYYKVIGDPTSAVQTKTRSEAWVLPCAEAVVKVEGCAGGVSLDAIVVEEQQAA